MPLGEETVLIYRAAFGGGGADFWKVNTRLRLGPPPYIL